MSYDDINALLAAPTGPAAPSLQRLEDTLTSGYAHALALEAERLRLERRIAEVASKLGDPQADLRDGELSLLAERLQTADRDLTQLRGLLSLLKQRAREARIARPAPAS